MISSSSIHLLFFSGSATADAATLDQLYVYYLIAAAFVFLMVVGFITYIIFKYRADNDEDGEAPQIHSNKKVEISLTLLATVLTGIFFYLTISVIQQTNKPVQDAQADVKITAHQWWWEAEYPGLGAVTANEIHIPTNKRILLKFTSADVIHDWWVPELGRKMDVFPGKTTHLWLEVEEPGLYLGACSEFCGAQHAWMRIRVIAQAPKEFKKWTRENAKPAKPVAVSDSMIALGKKVFNKKTCGNCHTIRGTKNSGKIGPDLTHVASRKTLLTGKIRNTPKNMHRWLRDPQKVKKEAHMPRFILEKKQVKALAKYMEALK